MKKLDDYHKIINNATLIINKMKGFAKINAIIRVYSSKPELINVS